MFTPIWGNDPFWLRLCLESNLSKINPNTFSHWKFFGSTWWDTLMDKDPSQTNKQRCWNWDMFCKWKCVTNESCFIRFLKYLLFTETVVLYLINNTINNHICIETDSLCLAASHRCHVFLTMAHLGCQLDCCGCINLAQPASIGYPLWTEHVVYCSILAFFMWKWTFLRPLFQTAAFLWLATRFWQEIYIYIFVGV